MKHETTYALNTTWSGTLYEATPASVRIARQALNTGANVYGWTKTSQCLDAENVRVRDEHFEILTEGHWVRVESIDWQYV